MGCLESKIAESSKPEEALVEEVASKKAPPIKSGEVLGTDGVNGVEYRVLSPIDMEEAIEVFAECFTKGEPCTQLLQASKCDFVNFCRSFMPIMCAKGTTVIAVDIESGRMIGGFMANDFADPDPEDLEAVCENMDSDWTPLFACIGELEEEFKRLYGEVKPGRFFHQWMVGVLPHGRGRGVAMNTTKYLLELAERKGFELSFAEATGAVSTHILQKLGAEAQYFVDYSKWQHDGKAVFAPLVEQGHQGMSLTVFKHTSSGNNGGA